jgi:glutathione synthase
MALRFVFLMDPLAGINIRGDSTFVLMLESERRGHEVFHAEPKHLELRAGEPWVTAAPAHLRRVEGDHYTLGAPIPIALNEVDAVFVRKDPPFDTDYLVQTYMLDFIDRRRVVLINDPQAVRDFNEKLAAVKWPHLMPRTLIAADRKRIREFIDEVGRVVVKPLMMAGGTGIIQLVRNDRNTGSVLDLLTREGREMIEVQEYLEAVVDGDKRIVLLDGDPIGAVNRRPKPDDIRANMHVGGVAEPAKLSDRERVIVKELGPELKRRGLVFVGIDVIGGHLTEINVTSPTGLQEINRFDGVALEARFIDWIEAKVSEKVR